MGVFNNIVVLESSYHVYPPYHSVLRTTHTPPYKPFKICNISLRLYISLFHYHSTRIFRHVPDARGPRQRGTFPHDRLAQFNDLVRRGEEDETFQFNDFEADAQMLDKLLFVVWPYLSCNGVFRVYIGCLEVYMWCIYMYNGCT